MSRTTGIRKIHAHGCPARGRGEGDCNGCKGTWEATVWLAREGRKVRKNFATHGEARSWRADAQRAARTGELRSRSRVTLREASVAWLEGAQSGRNRNRSGTRYKPSVIRGYDAALRRRILPALGAARLSDLRRQDVQRLVDGMVGEGWNASTIRNALMPLRVIVRRAIEDGILTVNPLQGLRLPAVTGRRERVADPAEAAALLAALPKDIRPIYATAAYGGLRRDELQSLRWEDVDLAAGVIRVERSWDAKAGVIGPKSEAGERTVPLVGALRDALDQHKVATRREDGLVFGTSREHPFTPSNVRRRAVAAWRKTHGKECPGRKGDECDCDYGLEPIGLHECRHTFVSLMYEAGVPLERIGNYVGHAGTYMTERYRHLLPGNEAEATRMLDEYLARADTSARLAQLESGEEAKA